MRNVGRIGDYDIRVTDIKYVSRFKLFRNPTGGIEQPPPPPGLIEVYVL